MEETKLDRFVVKIFSFVESKTSFLFKARKNPKTLLILAFLQLFCGISLFLLRISFPPPNETLASKIFDFLQLIASLVIALIFSREAVKNIPDIDLKILQFSRKIYSEETIKFCFEPIFADWKSEYSEAISQKKYWQARSISIRYGWAFISAIFQQSRIGKILSFIKF